MEKRLTQEQLAQVIAEVQKLSQQREAEVDRELLKEILRELNLSPEFLEEALVQLQRQEALKVQQQRNRWLATAAMVIVIAAVALTTVFIRHHQQLTANVSVYTNRLTLAQDRGSNLTTIDRRTNPQIYYRVTLNNAPIGQKLSLSCNWIDPNGQIAHQNRYQTRSIDRTVWQTYCFYPLNPAAIAGPWKVQMLLEGRTLSTASFTVK